MLKKYEFSIDAALAEFTASREFRQQLSSGRYVYVENHFCINCPSYVQWSGGGPSLTDYAKQHQDVCCLGVDILAKKSDNSSGSLTGSTQKHRKNYRRDGSITKRFAAEHGRRVDIRGGSAHRFRVHGDRVFRCQPCPKRQPPILKHAKSFGTVSSLAETLPNNFTPMLDKLIESQGVKEEDLAAESNLSEKTIQRLRNHDPKNVTLETVLQLCIGLHLHPILSNRLLSAAGMHFMATNLHTMYQFLIFTCYKYSVEACNELLESKGFPSLGKSKK